MQSPGSKKRSLTGQTRLVPLPCPKTPLEYPETQSLLPSPDTHWHKGFRDEARSRFGTPVPVTTSEFHKVRMSYRKRGSMANALGSGTINDTAPRTRSVCDEETHPS